MDQPKITVLGVGNTLLKDEGVGVRVVEDLQANFSFPAHVKLVDGGTQGLWLMATIQESDHLIVIDAVLGDGVPGTIYRLQGDDLPKGLRAKTSAHDSDLVEAINACKLIDVGPQSVVVIGIQPSDITPYGLELTAPIAEKVGELTGLVLRELEQLGVKPKKKV
jgi:hydrogenase maturation protease